MGQPEEASGLRARAYLLGFSHLPDRSEVYFKSICFNGYCSFFSWPLYTRS